MNEKELLRALGNVNEEFITESLEAPKKHPAKRWLIAAACLALVCAMGIGVAATTDMGVWLKEITSNIWDDGTIEIGYHLNISLKKMPLDDIKGDVREVKDIILQQYENFGPLSSQLPNTWYKNYQTAQEALDYLGCDHLRLPDLGWQEQRSQLSVMGTNAGDFTYLSLEVDYQVDDFRMQAFARIYTELYDGEVTTGSLDPYRDAYENQAYVTPSGKNCVIMYGLEDGAFCYVDGYIVSDNILHNLNVIGSDQAKAEALLYQWLDSF